MTDQSDNRPLLTITVGEKTRQLRLDVQTFVSLGVSACGLLDPKLTCQRLGLGIIEDQPLEWLNAASEAIAKFGRDNVGTLRAITKPKGGA